MIRSVLFVHGLLAAATWCAGQGRGSVKVTVLGDHDAPMPGARVMAMPITRCALAYALPECLTDDAGSCTLDLHYDQQCGGKYSISASKVEDGYPGPQEWHFVSADSTLKEAQVEVSAGHTTDEATVHLGKRGGIVEGTVADAVTGKPPEYKVEFRSVTNPENVICSAASILKEFRILIPSDLPVTMIVHGKGDEDWTYSQGKGATRSAIRLGPGEKMRLDIRLRPRE